MDPTVPKEAWSVTVSMLSCVFEHLRSELIMLTQNFSFSSFLTDSLFLLFPSLCPALIVILSSSVSVSQGPQGEPGPPGQQGTPGTQVRHRTPGHYHCHGNSYAGTCTQR